MDKDIDPMSLRLNTILSFAQRFKNDDKMISVLVNLKKTKDLAMQERVKCNNKISLCHYRSVLCNSWPGKNRGERNKNRLSSTTWGEDFQRLDWDWKDFQSV